MIIAAAAAWDVQEDKEGNIGVCSGLILQTWEQKATAVWLVLSREGTM